VGEIKNVVLEEIRKEDGAQRFTFPYVDGMPGYRKPPCNVMWLSGLNKAANAKVGMTGKLVYRTGPNWGLYFFEKD
jgi:hypothetical protein